LNEWNKILPEKVYSLEQPDETVVDFAGFLCGRKKKRVLDLACGAGRHVVYMAQERFEISGADISGVGLRMTGERLKKRGLTASLVRSVMSNLPFVSSSFDALICTRAIYHQRLRGIQETLCEIRRVLTKDGIVLIDFLSKRTHSYGKGVEIEKGTFIEGEGQEKGVMHHFANREELQNIFSGFTILNIDLREKEVEGKLRSRLIVKAIK
jgi:ubiquinone/menaquinone biosynthesis C-methylase UbiE